MDPSKSELLAAHRHCNGHREAVARSGVCGCFSCSENFSRAEITEWCDEGDVTALCPRCGIDSVLGDASGLPVTDPGFLEAMNKFFFS